MNFLKNKNNDHKPLKSRRKSTQPLTELMRWLRWWYVYKNIWKHLFIFDASSLHSRLESVQLTDEVVVLLLQSSFISQLLLDVLQSALHGYHLISTNSQRPFINLRYRSIMTGVMYLFCILIAFENWFIYGGNEPSQVFRMFLAVNLTYFHSLVPSLSLSIIGLETYLINLKLCKSREKLGQNSILKINKCTGIRSMSISCLKKSICKRI